MKQFTIREWSPDDRPREKLFKKGEHSLTTTELLAILLRTGTKGTSAVDLSRQILTRFGSLRNMSHTDTRDWKELKGLGQAKIAQIKAALELGRRFREEDLKETRPQIKSAKDVVDILMPQMRDLKTEIFKVVYLDNQNRIIDIQNIAIGTVDHAFPIIREIIHTALQKFAKSIVCVHNHPSGIVEPSNEDRIFTQKLKSSTQVIEIKLLDHIVIAHDVFYSFAEQGDVL
jgi:DNA repair protein RadC